MSTAFISHPLCLEHETGEHHPEAPARLQAIQDRLIARRLFDFLLDRDAPEATREQLQRVHDDSYLFWIDEKLEEAIYHGHAYLDPDTLMSPHSLEAARRAAGAAILAVQMIMEGKVRNAFCCVRPPGHHAERKRTMGFCIYNNVAIGIAEALERWGLARVALVDFDVHHGNGAENIFLNDERVLFCSSFEHPFFPEVPFVENHPRIICTPLKATAAGPEFRAVVTERWLPAIDAFKPQMIFISAGFDAHAFDDMSHVRLLEADYAWITERIVELADRHCGGRIVSLLEGGYDPQSLARSVEAHLRVLMDLPE